MTGAGTIRTGRLAPYSTLSNTITSVEEHRPL
jgi:hypothetical protein